MSLAKSIQTSLADPTASAIESGSRWFAPRKAARKAATRSALADEGRWNCPAVVGSAALGATVAVGAALAYYNVRKARQNKSASLPVGRFISADDVRESSRRQLETVTATTNSDAEGMRAIAAEATEYSRQSFDNSHAFFEKLMRAQRLDDVIELQSDFVRKSYGNFISRALKVVELCSNMAIEAFASSLSVSEAIVKVPGGTGGKLLSEADRQAKEIASNAPSALKPR